MRIALIDTTASTNNTPRLYPIALLKLGAWLKTQGEEVDLFMNRLPGTGEYDAIWISTLFTFDIPKALGMVIEAKKRAKYIRVGGIASTLIPEPFEKLGVELHKGLHDGAERMVGDYSLLPESPRYAIVYTSRGCVRNCGFCMVHRLEPEFRDLPDWENQLPEIPKGSRFNILIYDNNWLAKPPDLLARDAEKLRELHKNGRIRKFDFNQGLDCRLMTEATAELLEGIPIYPVRFAFDWKAEDGYYQDAVRMMAKRGFREFISYMLYNYKDNPGDFYYRLKESARLTEELGVQVKSFPMRYQPILEVDPSRKYVGSHWSETMIGSFRRILAAHSTFGQVSCLGGNGMRPLEEFEYWFGRDEEEFVKLLTFPEIRELIKRKKSALRHYRLGVRENGTTERATSRPAA